MAKKIIPASKPTKSPAPAAKPAAKAVSTPVRHSAVPKMPAVKPAAAPASFGYDDIALKAYFISQSGTGGSESDNWHRAEAELRSSL